MKASLKKSSLLQVMEVVVVIKTPTLIRLRGNGKVENRISNLTAVVTSLFILMKANLQTTTFRRLTFGINLMTGKQKLFQL